MKAQAEIKVGMDEIKAGQEELKDLVLSYRGQQVQQQTDSVTI